MHSDLNSAIVSFGFAVLMGGGGVGFIVYSCGLSQCCRNMAMKDFALAVGQGGVRLLVCSYRNMVAKKVSSAKVYPMLRYKDKN